MKKIFNKRIGKQSIKKSIKNPAKITVKNSIHTNHDFSKSNFLTIFYLSLSGTILTLFSLMVDQWFFIFLSTDRAIFFVKLFSIITMIGNLEWFIALTFILLIIFISQGKKFYSFMAAIIFSAALSYILKMIILRPRPFEYFNISSTINTSFSSFPSGHALLIFTILPFITKNFPKYKIFFWIAALFVAFSRLYLGVHYLSDVVAGAFIGFIVGRIFIFVGEKNGWQ
jgi:undecaprenyl-diphosphatase